MEKLIGAKLVSLDEHEMIIEKDGVKYSIRICEDYGGCCGYNEISTKLLIEKGNEPVIVNYTKECDSVDGERCKIALFGECKEIAEIETFSSSVSGWGYGATVWIECNELDINIVLSSW